MPLKPEHRQTIWLVITTWTLSGILYLIISIFGGASTYVLVSVVNICVMGTLLSWGVWWTVRRTRRRNMAVRLAAMGVRGHRLAWAALIDPRRANGSGGWWCRNRWRRPSIARHQ